MLPGPHRSPLRPPHHPPEPLLTVPPPPTSPFPSPISPCLAPTRPPTSSSRPSRLCFISSGAGNPHCFIYLQPPGPSVSASCLQLVILQSTPLHPHLPLPLPPESIPFRVTPPRPTHFPLPTSRSRPARRRPIARARSAPTSPSTSRRTRPMAWSVTPFKTCHCHCDLGSALATLHPRAARASERRCGVAFAGARRLASRLRCSAQH